jgi:hypothetical protein
MPRPDLDGRFEMWMLGHMTTITMTAAKTPSSSCRSCRAAAAHLRLTFGAVTDNAPNFPC